MIFIKLIRYIKSYVRFTIKGGFLERFLNLCSRGGLPLWDVEPTGDGMEASTTVGAYKGMRRYARRAGTRIRVKERHGLRFVLYRYRHRKGLFLGLLCFLLFLGVMSRFIWKIEVRGNSEIRTQEVVWALEDLGVKPGTYIKNIDARWVEQNMLLKLEALSWVAVNIRGSTAEIEIKERTQPPEPIDLEGVPTNVVAGDTGQIKQMEVYEGLALLKEGDTVVEGDMIVTGVLQTAKGQTVLKHARAKVLAQLQKEIEVQVPLEQVLYFPTGQTVHKRLLIVFGLRIPVSLPGGTGEYHNRYYAEKNLEILGAQLPIALGITAYEVLDRQVVAFTIEQAQNEAIKQMENLEKQSFAESEIQASEFTASLKDDVYILRGQYKVLRDIAKIQEIYLAN